MGIDYLSTVMIFSMGLLAQICFERLLTSTGRTIFSMTSQLCGAITNIILDPILIFGLIGFPKMGLQVLPWLRSSDSVSEHLFHLHVIINSTRM